MIQILSESSEIGDQADTDPATGSTLSALEIKRLVLQPMDARLEYVHDLRKWLRGNGWHISQVSECHHDKQGYILTSELHVSPSFQFCKRLVHVILSRGNSYPSSPPSALSLSLESKLTSYLVGERYPPGPRV